MWPLGHKLCPTCMIYCPVKSSFCFQSNHFWFEVALGRILSTKWWSLHSAHDKPIILPKQSLTVQFSVFERLQFCCRMLLNVNGGQARAASTIFSKRSCNKFFQKCIKNFNALINQYIVDVFEAHWWLAMNVRKHIYLKYKLILCLTTHMDRPNTTLKD